MLTRKQLDLLKFIHERVQSDGVSPSFDEMKVALDLKSKSGIHRLITALEERGFIRRLAHRARAIEIVKLPEGMDGNVVSLSSVADPDPIPGFDAMAGSTSVPVMGRIAAGTPISAIQHPERNVIVPGDMLAGAARHYALEVKGDSMIDAGIHSGDVVVIKEQPDADSGDIVVALVEDQEATLKRLRKQGSAVALEAANPAYETRIYHADQVRVQGRLVGLIRTY